MSIRIDAVSVPGSGGRIGMCACPGGRGYYSGDERALAEDLDRIRTWGASGVISLIEREEIEMLAIRRIDAECESRGMWWRHLPIRDMCAPDTAFETRWAKEVDDLRRLLQNDGRLVLHCWAGLGRTGTVAAKLLMEFGLPAADAIARVREARPGTIQSLQQEIYLQRLADGIGAAGSVGQQQRQRRSGE